MGCKHSALSTTPDPGTRKPPPPQPVAPDLPLVRPSNENFHENNIVSNKLGKGAYASVYAVSKGDGEEAKYAAKVVNLRLNNGRASKTKEQMVARELQILQKVTSTGSDCVVRFMESFTESHYVYMVMEKCDETLIEVLKSLEEVTESTYRPLLQGMLQGLEVVHLVGVVHRDVKPDNYMCCLRGDGRVIKLCDFGLAKSINSAYKNELVGVNGTAPFMAPEMVKGLPYSAKVDTWSLGVIVYLMLYGHFPYMPAIWTSDEMKFAIRLGNPAPTFMPKIADRSHGDLSGSISSTATSLCSKLLNRSGKDRLTAEEALHHSFFTKKRGSDSNLGGGGSSGSSSGDLSPKPAPSLKPMLESAETFGAFGQTHQKEQEEPSDMDVRIATAQVQHGHASPWSRQTSAGSNFSGGPCEVVGQMDSDADINGDIPS